MFAQKSETAAVVSDRLPLLSNLNMIENIALVLEVHQKMSVQKAESVAFDYLKKLGSEMTGNKRIAQCSEKEVFYVKLIRAMLAPFMEVLIVTPSNLTDKQHSANFIHETVTKLESVKNVTILDLKSNESHYLGKTCVTLLSK